jgi:hypothetical protein
MVKRMSGLGAISANALSMEVGIAQPTLSNWLRASSVVQTAQSSKSVIAWTAEEKLNALLEASGVGEAERGAWLREKGLRSEDLDAFRAAAKEGLSAPKFKGVAEQKRIQTLERQLARSNAALAETAAILVLRKKAVALWGEEGENT